jgi:hypothetical protein
VTENQDFGKYLLTNRLYQVEDRLLGLRTNDELLHSQRHKDKTRIMKHNFKGLWYMIKRSNLGVFGIEDGVGI